MRLITSAIVGTALTLATPVLAKDKAWYIGVEGGPTVIKDINFDIGTTRSAARTDLDAGFDVDAIVGYDFGAFRLEAEVGYRDAKNIRYNSLVSIPGYGGPANVPFGITGRTNSLSLMMNGLFEFGDPDELQGFAGGGVGVAKVRIPEYTANGIVPIIRGSDTVIAYQLFAGGRLPVSPNIDLSLKYRYASTGTIGIDDALGRRNAFTLPSHSFLFGFTFNFASPVQEPNPNPTDEVM